MRVIGCDYQTPIIDSYINIKDYTRVINQSMTEPRCVTLPDSNY